MHRAIGVVGLILAVFYASVPAGAAKSDIVLCETGIETRTTEAEPAPVYYQVWGYIVDPYERVTCIGYFGLGNTRFAKAPRFTSTYSGDHLGWSTYISPDKRAVFIFGPRSHFGPNLAQSYGISYVIYYESSPVAQDTVVWDGAVQTFAWSRTGTPGNGGYGEWTFSSTPQDGPYSPVAPNWMSMSMDGSLNFSAPSPSFGDAFQMGPAMFGGLPGPWGNLLSYSASPGLPQVEGGDLNMYGWAMNGTIDHADPAGLVQVWRGNWWLYYKPLEAFPIEQGTFLFRIAWESGPSEPAQVTGKLWAHDGSTVVRPPWPVDYVDWSTMGVGSFTGELESGGSITGSIPASDNKLVLKSPLGQDVLYVRSGQAVNLELHQQQMAQTAVGYQAFLQFDPTMLGFVSGSYSLAPYGMEILNIVPIGGSLDLAAGIYPSTQPPYATDSKLADLHFVSGAIEGITQVMFRVQDPLSQFTDEYGNGLITHTVDGPIVIVDNTPPVGLTLAVDPAGWTNSSSVTLTFSAVDPLSGILRYMLQLDENDAFQATSPYVLDISALGTGQHTISVTAYDRAGNFATVQATIYVDRDLPTISIDSAQQEGHELISGPNALQGAVDIYVTAADGDSGLADLPTVTVTPNGGSPEAASYVDRAGDTFHYAWVVTELTPNGPAQIDASCTDAAGNSASAAAFINVNKSQAVISIELIGARQSVTRLIAFTFGGTGGTVSPWKIYAPVNFVWDGVPTHSAIGSITLRDLSNAGQWTRIGVRDEQHTLLRTVDLMDGGNRQFSADLTGSRGLVSGDATADNVVDILDFGVFIGQYGTTGHPYAGRDADFSCNGTVWTEDFSILQTNFLMAGDALPGKAIAASAVVGRSGRTSVPVMLLKRIVGETAAAKADLNFDGIVDLRDVTLFARGQTGGRR